MRHTRRFFFYVVAITLLRSHWAGQCSSDKYRRTRTMQEPLSMRCGNMSVRTSILSRYASKLTTRPTISVLRPSYMVGGKNGQGSILSIFPPRCTQNMDGDVSGFANVVGVHQTGNVADHSSTPDKMRRQNSRHSSNNSFTPTVKMVCFFAIAPLLLISHTALVVAATGVLHLGNTDYVMDIAARACGASGARESYDVQLSNSLAHLAHRPVPG